MERGSSVVKGPGRPLPPWIPYAISVVAVGACTAVNALLLEQLPLANLVMIYLATVLAIAAWVGRGPAVLASCLSSFAFAFLFVPPYRSMTIDDPKYIVTFIVMLFVALVVSAIAEFMRRQATRARQREQRMAALYSLSRELACTRGVEELKRVVCAHVNDVFHGTATVRLEGGAAEQAEEPGAIRIPLVASGTAIGTLSFTPRRRTGALPPHQVQLLETFASLAAVALERERLAQEASESRIAVEAEQLRNTLLTSISHDLRTPLASIKGASSLLLQAPHIKPDDRSELIRDIHDEADFMSQMVTNLLELTRLESGAVRIHKEPQPLDEIVGAVVDRLERRLERHPLTLQLPKTIPMVPMDAVLIQQVVFNLLENAITHTGEGTPITLSVSVEADAVTLAVADRGPGINPGTESVIFDKFFRILPENRRSGMGLGLALCEAIVRLHGGRIWAENRPGGGAVFQFCLPCAATSPHAIELGA